MKVACTVWSGGKARDDIRGLPITIKMAYYAVTVFIAGIVTFVACNPWGNNFPALIIRGGICIVIPNLIIILGNFKGEEFHDTKEFLLRILKSRE